MLPAFQGPQDVRRQGPSPCFQRTDNPRESGKPLIMANLFLTGNHLAFVLGVSLEAGAWRQADGAHQIGAAGGSFGPRDIRGFSRDKFLFSLVDKCGAGLQWSVPHNDNIHKRQSRQARLFSRVNLHHE